MPASLADFADDAAAWVAHQMSVEALRGVVEVCDRAGIDVLPVKGILTGPMLYADLGERPLADVDVRVRPSDVPRLVLAGARAGWKQIRWSRTYRNVVFHVAGRMVDVEATVGPPGLCGLRVADMIARSTVEREPFGFAHRRPELHDHALLLCVNVFKDKIAAASAHATADLERVASLGDFDAGVLADLARRSHVSTLVWMIADWMARERGSAPWAEVRARVRGVRPFYARVVGRVLRDAPESLAARVLARAAADRARSRAEALATLAAFALESAARD